MSGRLFLPAACLVLVWGAAHPLPQARAAEELDRLHVLIAVDTDDPSIGRDSAKDRDTFKKLLADGIPRDRYTADVLEGKQLTKRNLLTHFQRLRVGKQDGLVLLFSGHGVADRRDEEHFLHMQGPEQLLARRELREAMLGTGAGLVVLVTDACNSIVDIPPSARAPSPHAPRAGVAPGYRRLLFEARGLVDLNGAMIGTPGWSDPDGGGVFTRSLMRTFQARRDDPNVTWPSFYAELSRAAQGTFAAWKKAAFDDVRSGRVQMSPQEQKDLEEQETQAPQAFFLPGCKVGLAVQGKAGGKGVLPDGRGVRIIDLVKDSPALRAGLKRGEVIVKIDGREIRGNADFDEAIDTALARSRTRLKLTLIDKDGQVREQTVALLP